MQLVRSRGGDHHDLSAGAFSVLSAIGVLDDVVFPDRIHTEQLATGPRRCNELAGRVGANVVDAVH